MLGQLCSLSRADSSNILRSHPSVPPLRSSTSSIVWSVPVFHTYARPPDIVQNSIREGYWALHDAALEGRKVVEDNIPMETSPPHIRHCIDLIRQSLICKPDTTVEVKNEELGGVTGFGTKHQCRDWDQLVSWTREWQAYGQVPHQETESQDPQESHSHQGHM